MFDQFLDIVNAVSVFTLCFLLLWTVINRLDIPKRASQVIIAAFSLRVATAVPVDAMGTFAGQNDFWKFNAALQEAGQLLRNGVILAPLKIAADTGDLFYIPYTAIFAPVYAVFGEETLLARILFALVGALFVLNVYRLGRFLNGSKTGLYASGISAVFPYWLYLSVIFYRDMLIMLILSQFLLLLLRLIRFKDLGSSVGLVAMAGLSIVLRPENILPIGIGIIVAGYVLAKRSRSSIKAAFALLLAGGTLGGIQRPGRKNLEILPEVITTWRRSLARGGGEYLGDITLSNWPELFLFVPVSTFYFVFVPFPWQLHNSLAMIAFLQNMIIWYPILVLLIPGIRYTIKRRPSETLVVLGFVLSGFTGYGLAEANMGPALRHRSQFQFPIIVFASIVIAERVRLQSLGFSSQTESSSAD